MNGSGVVDPRQSRKKISYEVFDDENADGGPTPAPRQADASSSWQHAKRRRINDGAAVGADDEHGQVTQLGVDADGDGQQDGRPGRQPSSNDFDERAHQLLPVARLGPDFDGQPDSGEQYLALVRREAEAAPHVTRATMPATHPSATDSAPPTAEKADAVNTADDKERYLPPAAWRQHRLSAFKATRQTYILPPPTDQNKPVLKHNVDLNNRRAWFQLVHKRKAPPSMQPLFEKKAAQRDAHLDEEESFNVEEFTVDGRVPSPRLLSRLSQAEIRAVLRVITDILRPFHTAARDTSVNPACVAARRVITKLHSDWLFALLTFLDAHLLAEELSELRSTARELIFCLSVDRLLIRQQVRSLEQMREAAQRKEADGAAQDMATDEAGQGEDAEWTDEYEDMLKTSTSQSQLAAREAGAWTILCLIAGQWGQHDLLDEAAASLRQVEAL